MANLGIDPLDAQIRQVAFFDTPDLTLNKSGVVVRARRVQRKVGDTVVKIRPLVPDEIPTGLRKSPAFGVEVDAMPGGFVCSGSMKAEADDAAVREVFAGRRPLRKLLGKEQRALFSAYAPDGVTLDDLSVLGPINVFKLKFVPEGYDRRMVAELWLYPDGSRIVGAVHEVSTRRSVRCRRRDPRLPHRPRDRPARRATDKDQDRTRVLRQGARGHRR